jgi:heme/copper-type cytochrome/quinol oxidase subunit 2
MMPSRMRQIVVYSKLTIVCAIFLAVAVVVFMNRNYKTNFWPGADGEPVSTLWLMLATAITSVLLFWIFAKARRVFRELTQVRAEQAMAARLSEQERLKKSLDDQERRIDEKIKRAIGPDEAST